MGGKLVVVLGMSENEFRMLALAGEALGRPVQIKRAGSCLHTGGATAGTVLNHILDQGEEHRCVPVFSNILAELKAFSKLDAIPLEVL